MLKTIALTQGQTAIISEEDYESLVRFKWFAWKPKNSKTFYAVRSCYDPTTQRRWSEFMHRTILQPPPGVFVDHIDGNGLNNSRTNIRMATSQENMRNRSVQKNNTTGFRGVTWNKRKERFIARIKIAGKTTHIGTYSTAAEASAAYEDRARQMFGNFYRKAN